MLLQELTSNLASDQNCIVCGHVNLDEDYKIKSQTHPLKAYLKIMN